MSTETVQLCAGHQVPHLHCRVLTEQHTFQPFSVVHFSIIRKLENRSLMNIIRQRQKNWLGHVLRSESLLCTVSEDRMKWTRTRGRQSDTMIDWMKSNDVEYEHIKKRAYDIEDCCHWRPGCARKGRAHKR